MKIEGFPEKILYHTKVIGKIGQSIGQFIGQCQKRSEKKAEKPLFFYKNNLKKSLSLFCTKNILIIVHDASGN